MAYGKALTGATLALALVAGGALAKVPEEVVARMDQDLTPFGSERAGNGQTDPGKMIPTWEGGITEPPPNVSYTIGIHHPDPWPEDRPLFTINGQNVAQHAGLMAGTHKSMIEAYPDTYFMNVYQSRRSCANPPNVYEANKRNARVGELVDQGNGISMSIMGNAFPIPTQGNEAMWNHKLQFRNYKATRQFAGFAPTRGGSYTQVVVQDEAILSWSDPSAEKAEDLDNISIWYIAHTIAPARSAGNVVLVHETINQRKMNRKAWVYSPGTRRVRRAPNIAYDNPGTNSDGLATSDSFNMFNGAMDRYDWTYLKKIEAYIPYNDYRFNSDEVTYDQMIQPGHINQDLVRYELHRTHVVEANLRDGTRHIYKKRRFYLDEDSWNVMATEIYDNRDELWRLQENHIIIYYEVPNCTTVGSISYDLNAGRYLALELTNQEPPLNWFADELQEDRYTPDSIRRLGVR